MNTTKQRSSNIELLRIVSMLMIITSHYANFAVMRVGQENAYETWTTGSTVLKFLTSSCIIGQIGVGIFFAITGYFTVEKKDTPSLKKIISEVLFYALLSVVIMILGITVCGYAYGGKSDLILLILQTICVPLTGSLWWFVTAYAVLILFSKSINSFVSSLNRNGYIIVILAVGIFGLLLGELGSALHDLEKAVFYYLLGGYFKLYSKDSKRAKWLLSGVGVILLLLINGVLQYNIYSNSDAVILRKFFSMASIIIEPLLVSALFYLFVNLRIGVNTFVNKTASYTFGIYLFHEAPYTRGLLWNRLVNADPYYVAGGGTFLAYSAAVIAAVFLIGAVIDILRQKLIDKKMIYVIDRIEEKFKKSFLEIDTVSK